MRFIDLEKACNKVSREVVWLALVKADTSNDIEVIKNMYNCALHTRGN